MTLPLAKKLSIGVQTIHRRTEPATAPWEPRIDDLVELVQLVDRSGYDSLWAGDHISYAIPILDPMLQLAQAAVVSRRLILGTSILLLPLRHPTPVAKQVTTLDHLTEGRFILGVGAGVLRSDAEALGLLDADRQAMFVESIDQVLAIWAGQAPYDIKGKFWNVSTMKTNWPEVGIGDIVKPYQKPHPFIVGTASDPGSRGVFELGKRGWGPVSSNLLHVNCLANHWTSYAKGAAEAGRTADREIWRVARSIFVSEDSKVAKSYGGDDANSPYRFYMRQLLMKLGKFKRLASFKAQPDMPDEEVTLEYVLENIVIRGTVNEVVDRILAMHETIGDFGTLLYCGKDWTDVALGRKSMELMAEKVMPAVNAAIGKSATRRVG